MTTDTNSSIKVQPKLSKLLKEHGVTLQQLIDAPVLRLQLRGAVKPVLAQMSHVGAWVVYDEAVNRTKLYLHSYLMGIEIRITQHPTKHHCKVCWRVQ